jgi:hypothetical protein
MAQRIKDNFVGNKEITSLKNASSSSSWERCINSVCVTEKDEMLWFVNGSVSRKNTTIYKLPRIDTKTGFLW